MKKRCLIWLRTSTQQQEVESMKKDLYEMAGRYGYKERDCTVVGRQGASAIKADDAYNEEIEELYKSLNTGKYNCLFAWELSRLGRREEYVIKLKNYLIQNKIQLRIAKPTLYLLEDDGTVNNGMELAISLFITLSKQEMEVKKERMLRGRRRVKSEGKFSGGRYVRFGYKKLEDGTIAVDEEDSSYVKEIFERYLKGESSISIYKNFNERGIFPDVKNWNIGSSRILKMIRCKSYCGQAEIGHIYPPIVSEQTIDECIRISSEHKAKPKSLHKYVYYCKGLIECCECGHIMVAHRANCAYRCKNYNHVISLSINVMDYIAWEQCKILKPYLSERQNQETLAEYERTKKEEERIIAQMKKKLSQVAIKEDRINEQYIDMHISKEKMKQKLAETALERSKLNEGIKYHLSRFEAASRLANGVIEAFYQIDDVTDDKMRQKYISDVLSMKVRKMGKGHFGIYIYPKMPIPRDDWYEYEAHGCKVKLLHHWRLTKFGDKQCEDVTGSWDMRFKRK